MRRHFKKNAGRSKPRNSRLARSPQRLVIESLESRCLFAGSPTVVDRYVFYNGSAFDGADAAISSADDGAIPSDKRALLPGQTAEWSNYTSYSRGINGLMIDVMGLADPTRIDAADFAFRMGVDANLANWTAAPNPSRIEVRARAGAQGSDRIVLIWNDHTIENGWLQVSVNANRDTGLTADDVFYFGNAVGESGNSSSDAIVNGDDELGARQHPRSFFNRALIDDRYDYNRDARVNATDEIIARNRAASSLPPLPLLVAPPVTETPTGLAASDGGYHDRIVLTWNAVAGATGYEIWRAESDDLRSARRIATQVDASYHDGTPFVEVPYRYWVRALGPGGNSPFSAPDIGHRATPNVEDIPEGTVRVLYNGSTGDIFVVANDVVNWYIESESRGLTGTPVGDLPGVGLVTDNDRRIGETALGPFSYVAFLGPVAAPGLPPGDLTVYWNASLGQPLQSGSVDFIGFFGLRAPTGVQASDTDSTAIRVTWNRTVTAADYEVWRGETNDFAAAQKVAETDHAAYFDTNVVPDRAYYYWVRSINRQDVSEPSASDVGQRPAVDGAFALYYVETGEIVVSVQNVTNWYVDSASSGLTGANVGTLPGNGLVTDNDRRIGETALAQFTYKNYALGAVAAPHLPPEDLTVYFQIEINRFGLVPVIYVPNGFPVGTLPAPTAVHASDGTHRSQVDIAWEPVAGATGYSVWRHTEGRLGPDVMLIGTTTATSIVDPSAGPGPVYYYWVAAQNPGAVSGLSVEDRGFAQAPAGPVNVQASDGLYEDRVEVRWDPLPDALDYQVWRGLNADFGRAIRLNNTGEPIYVDTTAELGRVYFYWVVATLPGGPTEPSDPDVGSRRSATLPAPLVVLATDNHFRDQIVVTWDAVPGASGYEIYRNVVPIQSTAVRVGGIATQTTYTDPVSPNSRYYYWVRATSGNVFGDFSSPDVGSSSRDVIGGDQVIVEYDDVSGEMNVVVRDVVNWYIESISAGLTGAVPQTLPAAGGLLTDNDRRIGETALDNFSYEVQLGPVALPGLSESDLVVWYNDDLGVPTRQGILRITHLDGTPELVTASDGQFVDRIRVDWSSVAGAQSYQVWRSEVRDTNSATLVAEGLTELQYEDTSALAGRTYYYWIRVLTANGLSRFGRSDAGALAAPPDAPQSVQASDALYLDRITVSWSVVVGASSYQVLRSETDDIATAQLIAENVANTTLHDTSAIAGHIYYYWVRAAGIAGLGPASNPDPGSLGALPDIPLNVQASDDSTDGVRISWTASPGASHYQVWRNTTDNTSSAVRIGLEIADTTYVDRDPNLVVDQPYYYWVVAVNGVGTSPFSVSDIGSINVRNEGPGTAAADYHVASGEIVVRINDVVNWYVQSASGGLTGEPVGDLPGPGLVTDNNSRIGETALGRFAYHTSLGNVAAVGLPAGDLIIFWNADLGQPLQHAPVRYIDGTVVRASDYEFEDKVIVNWNELAGAQSYQLYRGESPDFAQMHLLADGLTNTSYEDTAVQSGTLYYYRVRPVVDGVPQAISAANAGSSAIVPAVVTSVRASDQQFLDRIVVEWAVAIGAQSYQVYRSSTDDFASAQLLAENIPATQYVDTAVAVNDSYFYWIRGAGILGLGPVSDSEQGSALAGPAAPTNVTATDNSVGGIVVSWTPSHSATGYAVWRNTVDDVSTAVLIRNISAADTRVTDLDPHLIVDQPYYYWVMAVNAAGSSGFSLPDIGSIDVRNDELGTVAADYNVGSGEIIVRINEVVNWYIQSTSGGLTGAPVGDLPGPGLVTDNNSRIGETALGRFTYHISLGDVAAVGLPAGDLIIYWNADLGQPLHSAPVRYIDGTVVRASDYEFADKVIVSWNELAGAQSYQLYRGESPDFEQMQLLADGLTNTSYEDTAVQSGTLYYYRARAVVDGVPQPISAANAGSSAIVPAVVTSVRASDQQFVDRIVVEWAAAIGAQSYQVYRSSTDDFASAQLLAENIPATQYVDTAVAVGDSHFYWIRGVGILGSGPVSESDRGSVLPRPAAPTNVAATDDSENGIDISWTASPAASTYAVWRNTIDDVATAVRIGSTSQTNFTDSDPNLIPNQPYYYYWVVAANDAGASPFSLPDIGSARNANPSRGTASAEYHVATGEIFVRINDVVNWYIQSTSSGLTGAAVGDLPGPGLVTDNNSRVGETALGKFSYQISLGNVAAPGLAVGDLVIFWNSDLGQPLRSAPVIYV